MADNSPRLSSDSAKDDHEALLDKTRSRPRSETLGSFSLPHLLPISQTQERQRKSSKDVTLLDGVSLLIGLAIGSGIFSSPGVIVNDVSSSGAAMIVWLVSGLLAWSGAACYSELGSMLPMNGGAIVYLQYSFGPLAAYLFTWTSVTALKSGSAAIIALVFGEYMCRVFYHTAYSTSSEQSVQDIPLAVIKLVALGSVLGVSLLNALSNRIGLRAQAVLTSAKLLALLVVVIFGIIRLAKGQASPALRGNIFQGSSTTAGNYALALYSGLWSFEGWDTVNYVLGEMKDANDLPKVIHGSMSTVLLMYLVTNIAYFVILPIPLVAHSNTIALDVGKAVLGPIGGVLFALIVAVSCFGALNSNIFTSARLIMAAGKEGFLPSIFATTHKTRDTPIYAMLLQGSFATIFVVVGSFKSLVVFYSICSWSFYLATVVSLLVLRIREPDLPRPYKTWLVTPICFCCVSVFLLFMPVLASPVEAMAAACFVGSGLPLYFLTKGLRDPGKSETGTRKSFLGKLKHLFSGSGHATNEYTQADQDELAMSQR